MPNSCPASPGGGGTRRNIGADIHMAFKAAASRSQGMSDDKQEVCNLVVINISC